VEDDRADDDQHYGVGTGIGDDAPDQRHNLLDRVNDARHRGVRKTDAVLSQRARAGPNDPVRAAPDDGMPDYRVCADATRTARDLLDRPMRVRNVGVD